MRIVRQYERGEGERNAELSSASCMHHIKKSFEFEGKIKYS